MSDYTPVTDFSAKDALTSGDAEKIILGADFDVEFAAIQTAIATKFDSTDMASSAQAEAAISSGASNSVIISPLRLWNWANANSSVVEDLQAVASLAGNGDKLFFFDDTDDTSKALTVGDGLEISTTTIQTRPGAGLVHATGELAVGAGSGITVNANDVALTDVSAGAAQPVAITSGVFSFDLSSITEITAPNLSQSADGILINDAGTLKVLPLDQNGIQVVNAADAIQTFAITDANTMQVLDSTTNRVWTIPTNASVAFEIGTIILIQSIGTATITITASTGVVLTSVYNASSTTATSDTVSAGGRAALIKVAADEWTISGNIVD